MKPDLVIWPKSKHRPKTLYLLLGLEKLGIEVVSSDKWMRRLRPRSNPLGPYVYPIEFKYGEKEVLVLYDINTIPRQFFDNLMTPDRFYFKTHLHLKDKRKYKNLFVAPNSPSNPELFLQHLEGLRFVKDEKKYDFDFFFLGWHDDRGMRRQAVKIAKSRTWASLAFWD